MNSLIALCDQRKVRLDPKAMNIKQREVNMLTVVDFAKTGFTLQVAKEELVLQIQK